METNAFAAWFTPEDRTIREARGYQTLFFAVWLVFGVLAFVVFSSLPGYIVAVIGASMVLGVRHVSRRDTQIMWTLMWVEVFILFGRFIVVLGLFPIALAVFLAGLLAIWMRGRAP